MVCQKCLARGPELPEEGPPPNSIKALAAWNGNRSRLRHQCPSNERKFLHTLQRRIDHLTNRVATRQQIETIKCNHDEREISALTWAINKIAGEKGME